MIMEQLSNTFFIENLIASSIVILMLSHAWLGFLKTKARLSIHIRLFMWFSLIVVTYYFFKIYSQPTNILDAYYFLWWVFYFQTLIILKGRALQGCKTFTDIWNNFFKFDTYLKPKKHEKINH